MSVAGGETWAAPKHGTPARPTTRAAIPALERTMAVRMERSTPWGAGHGPRTRRDTGDSRPMPRRPGASRSGCSHAGRCAVPPGHPHRLRAGRPGHRHPTHDRQSLTLRGRLRRGRARERGRCGNAAGPPTYAIHPPCHCRRRGLSDPSGTVPGAAAGISIKAVVHGPALGIL